MNDAWCMMFDTECMMQWCNDAMIHDDDAWWEGNQAIIRLIIGFEICVETNRPTNQDINFKMVRCRTIKSNIFFTQKCLKDLGLRYWYQTKLLDYNLWWSDSVLSPDKINYCEKIILTMQPMSAANNKALLPRSTLILILTLIITPTSVRKSWFLQNRTYE